MDRQSANIGLECAACGQAVQSCTCANAATVSLSDKPCQHGFAPAPTGLPHLVTSQTCSEIGSIVDKNYELIAELGSGGMGTVFKAHHVSLPKFFAVKILRRELSNDPDFRNRFAQEAKTASLLNHPHLVSIYDYGTTDYGENYLVMDFIEGHSLADALTTLKRIEQRQAVKIFTQICEGLTHAHGLGVIHRDLKPSNIMLVNTETATDIVKVVDFGIAKMIGADGSIAHITQSLTKTGEFFGSPLYMSPEQGNGGNPDHRTDVYSMGVLMYECLTSAPPFRGDNFYFTMMLHNEASPKPFENALGISEELEGIVFKALEKNPDDRYQSMEEMRLALLDIFADENGSPRARKGGSKSVSKGANRSQKPGEKEIAGDQPRSNFAIVAGCLLALLMAVAAGTWFFDHQRSAPASPLVAATPAPTDAVSRQLKTQAPPNLPPIPDSVKLPETAKNMTAEALVIAGTAAEKAKDRDYHNLLPALYFTRAALKEPQLDDAYAHLLQFYFTQREHAPGQEQNEILQKCLAVYKEQVRRNPNNAGTYVFGGTIYQYLHMWPEALANAEDGLKLSPEMTDLHIKHAYALSESNRKPEAVVELEKYNSSDGGALWTLGSCYRELGEYEKCIEFASTKLKQLGPQSGLLMLRADSYKDLKRYKEAVKDYQLLFKLQPDQLKERAGALEECKNRLKAEQKQ